MREQSLSGQWAFREHGTDEWRPATVPGGVYGDLLELDEIPDPRVGDNDLDVQWVGKSDWDYRRTFVVEEDFLDHERVTLVCEGLDTVASILVNGTHVGESVNMHTGSEFAVGHLLEPGENELLIAFRSPVEYAIEAADRYPYDVPCVRFPHDQPGRQFVRKAQYHFGWDWGPSLPTMGVYRDVRLLAHSGPRVRYVTTEQDHGGNAGGGASSELATGDVEVTVTVGAEAPVAGAYDLDVSVGDASTTERVTLETGRSEVTVTATLSDPDRWWPRGHGDQTLQDVTVTLAGQGEEHTVTDRIGIRTVELDTAPDAAGTAFAIEVNGRPIFAKGANVIPPGVMHREVTAERLTRLVEDAVAANMNALRVWGGGYYLDDAFYDRCDEAGILVWQDFAFACALHPANPEFLDSVDREVRQQVRRLEGHPSIALWCANNENEEALTNWYADHEAHEAHVEDYAALYAETVAPACRETDPSRPYWPGSPSSGPDTDDPYRFDEGDVHYWDVWHEGQPVANYVRTAPRFVSEFGYQSFPSRGTLERAVGAEQGGAEQGGAAKDGAEQDGAEKDGAEQDGAEQDGGGEDRSRAVDEGTAVDGVERAHDDAALNPTAPLVEHHQRNRYGTGTICRRLTDHFRLPFDLGDFCYVTQLQQGLAMKTAIEHWRRRRPTTMGALYWQLNDCWPAVSWASVEDDGTWKAQQYLARRQFAPVLVSFAPEYDEFTENRQGERIPGDVTALTCWVTSDRPEPVEGTLTCAVRRLGDGEAVLSETVEVTLAAGESDAFVRVEREDLPENVGPADVMVVAGFEGDGQSHRDVGFFEPPKRLTLPDANPTVAVSDDGSTVTVESDETALFVAVDHAPVAGVLGDNYVHLLPGEQRGLAFEARSPLGEGNERDPGPAGCRTDDDAVGATSDDDLAERLREAVSVRHLQDTF